ncbi:MAG: helicase-related protein [Sumerlaeia bacterium]
MPKTPPKNPLPIDPLLPDFTGALSQAPGAVLLAPPGAGKTTRLPPALAGAGWLSRENPAVVLLQPRRVAARAAASRIAEENGWRVGEEVGYHIRFDRKIGPRTRIRVLTEGILTRQIQGDPFLEGIGCVILDEFHERSIHTDVALALLREIQTTVRPDLRIVVMSATMNPAPVQEFLGGVPALESEGRMFPVEVEHLDRADEAPIPEQAARAVRRALVPGADPGGHILVFLPGIGEIRRTEQLLSDLPREFDRHILHSSVKAADQDAALRPSAPGRRKIVLATNIAETSLTIDGVRTVVDCGWARVMMSDARLGIDRLELRRISQASATQRMGRAGRTGPGRCLRLWTRSQHLALDEHDAPEIHRADLAATVLALRGYGVRDLSAFTWFEPPRPDALARAERLLWMLGAAREDGTLTPEGEKLAALPLHPRLGMLLLEGARQGRLEEAAAMAALLSERDIVSRGDQRRPNRHEGASDVLDRLELLESGGFGADPAAVAAVERVRGDLLRVARRVGIAERKA